MVCFRMAVGKSKSAPNVVTSAGSVAPIGVDHVKGKRSVVQSFGIFVHEHPKSRRAGRADVGGFAERAPWRIAAMIVRAVEPRAVDGQIGNARVAGARVKAGVNRADVLAHGKRARGKNGLSGERGIGSGIFSLALIGRATEHRGIFAQVTNEQ